MTHATRLTLLLLVAVTACALCPGRVSAQIVVSIDFESQTLPSGWAHYAGGENPWNAGYDYNDPGAGSGQWLTLVAVSADDFAQSSGIETAVYDLSSCHSAVLSFDLYNNEDEADYCPDSWDYFEPPAGDCLGASGDFHHYHKVLDLTGEQYEEHRVHRVSLQLDELMASAGGMLSFYLAEHDNFTFASPGDGLLFDNFTITCGESRCSDGVDNDQDGYEDCDDTDCWSDIDGDGASACVEIPGVPDCDDLDPALNVDDLDGDGWSTCEGDCDDLVRELNPDDLDGDGLSSCEGDCADNNGAVSPEFTEDCGDGEDTDCDGFADDEDDDCWPAVGQDYGGEDWGGGCSFGGHDRPMLALVATLAVLFGILRRCLPARHRQ